MTKSKYINSIVDKENVKIELKCLHFLFRKYWFGPDNIRRLAIDYISIKNYFIKYNHDDFQSQENNLKIISFTLKRKRKKYSKISSFKEIIVFEYLNENDKTKIIEIPLRWFYDLKYRDSLYKKFVYKK